MRTLLLTLIAITLPCSLPAQWLAKFDKGPLEVWASSDDITRPDVRDSSNLLVACRTSATDTVSFSVVLRYTLNGQEISQDANVPRIPNNLNVGGGLLIDFPWTTVHFVIPQGGVLSGVAVEERKPAVAFVIPAKTSSSAQ